MIAGSQTIADDRRRSQAIAEVCFHMIADDRRIFCDPRSSAIIWKPALILSAISIDRLLALSLHLRNNSIVTVPRVTKLVIVIWILISVVTASKIWLGDKWVVFPIVMNVFAVLTTAFCTYKIFHIARKHLKQINKEIQAAIHMKSRAVEVVKCKNSAVIVIYLYVVMLLFYLPFLVVMVVENVRGVTSSVQLSYDLVTTFVFLNSSVNPIIFCWRMKQVRSAVKKCLRCGLT